MEIKKLKRIINKLDDIENIKIKDFNNNTIIDLEHHGNYDSEYRELKQIIIDFFSKKLGEKVINTIMSESAKERKERLITEYKENILSEKEAITFNKNSIERNKLEVKQHINIIKDMEKNIESLQNK